jgi:histidyl-tRNA synthetase
MSAQKPSIPKGTRDFSPQEMVKRNHIFDTIRPVFETYGYLPIETPAMENLSTLLGKYGEEGDKLLFRILNSGDFLGALRTADRGLQTADSGQPKAQDIVSLITEKGLRYDLTVPFARYVVQHQHEIAFPFRRYQIQPVWRADRPQKGRYREFFQCDVDVIGSDALLCEVELVQIIHEIFSKLGIGISVLVNNRKILAGIAEAIGEPDRLTELTTAIDKLEKAGLEQVNRELAEKGLSAAAINALQPILLLSGPADEKFSALDKLFTNSETGKKGTEEMRYLFRYTCDLNLPVIDFDLRLARGLNYYTGSIIEVKAEKVAIGSLCGGGRYDDLTGIFGLQGMSGVGVSFGADRICDVMTELDLFPPSLVSSTKVLFLNFGIGEEKQSMQLLAEIRKAGIAGEIYPDPVKLKKQMEYANRKNIPFVAMIGKDEMSAGTVALKNMATGEQVTLSRDDMVAKMTIYK